MSDPRTYEQLFESHLRQDADRQSAKRLLERERRIAELSAELAQREEEIARERSRRLESRGAEQENQHTEILEAQRLTAETRLGIATSERDAALREVERRAALAEGLKTRLLELEAQLGERGGVVAELEVRVVELEAQLGERADVVAELRSALEAAELAGRRQAAEYGTRIRELQQLASILAVGLAQTKTDIDRAAGSRAWRWGHGVTKAMRRLTLRRKVTEGALARALKRIEQIEASIPALSAAPAPAPLPAPQAAAPSPARDEREESERAEARAELAAEIRERLGSAPELPAWPPVSIVVPTREGLAHVERLLAGLEERTDYPELELIVVDNASKDGTLEFLAERELPFPLTTIANDEPASFSAANAQGVERARHDLILFLNNDIEPFERGWLRELVAAHQREGVGAVGATLLRSEAGNDPASRDRTVQHRSVRFRAEADGVRAYNHGDGEDLFDGAFGIEQRAPAVTAACLLIERDRFQAAGGFANGYRFGTEDVDLGLSLTAAGDAVLATGRSVLYHRESATQDSEGLDFKRTNRLANRRLFLERWGPRVRREYRLARLGGDPLWTDGGRPHVAITVTSLDPADGWGDWYTAHELGDSLAELGWRVTYVERKGDAWYELPRDLDYLLSLMDPFDLRRVPAEVTTIAWVRNWTERWLERPWFERTDVLLVSSGRSAELIEAATGRQTIRFPLATNPTRFAPLPPDPALAADYVFTGNHWGKDRDIQAGLAPRPAERLDVYGRGWEEVREIAPHARGPAAYEELPVIYSSAKLVLDDTSGPTLPYGAVNSRVFDALAAGTLAITNCESGVRELFGEDFPVWTSPQGLREQLDALLGDERRRTALAKRFRAEVLRHHTYAHRAHRLAEVLREHEARPSFCLKIGAPDWEQAERWGDLHFARAIQRELRGRGHRCLIQVLEEWENDEGLHYDVVVVIRGLSRHHPKPGQLNVLWNISHPAEVSGEECDGYDLVCVASEQFAATLRERTATPVVVLEQATDPSVFYPDPSPRYAHDLVYVANSRGVLRPIVRDLLPTELDLAIYGANWEGLIDTRYVVAEHVPNQELRQVYSSAKIVLCDHWDDMREHGFISNRIYDALACGATIVSDEVVGLAERFGDAVVTYRDAETLRAQIGRLLGSERSGPPDIAVGTFRDRVHELLEEVAALRGEPAAASDVRSAALR
jgi:GT2 family glycosyltransferase/spore maturation protein CgeB